MVDVISSLPFVGGILAESSATPAILTSIGGVPLFFKRMGGFLKIIMLLGSVGGLGMFFLPKIFNTSESSINPQYLESAKEYASRYSQQ